MRWFVERRGVAARMGALMFLGGFLLTLLGALRPNGGETDTIGYAAVGAFQLLVGALLVALPAKHSDAWWVAPLIVIGGVSAITLGLYFDGERSGGAPAYNEFFYVWPAIYVGYFLTARGIAASLALIGVAYTGVLIAMGAGGPPAATRIVVTMAVVSGVAVLLHILRRNIDGLLGQLRDTAVTDPLTELLNRRGFDERFHVELERSARSGAPLALLLGDLDRFKAINDRLGHAAGDEALAAVARTLKTFSRSVDAVGRMGGEEFALLLASTDAEGGFDAAERLRAAIAEAPMVDGAPLTISFGVVELGRDGQSAEELMRAADVALYAAKAQGRDRTVVLEHTPEAVPLRATA